MRTFRNVPASVAVVAAIAVFGVAGYIVVHHDTVSQAGQTIGYVSPPLVTPHPAASPPPTQPGPFVAFLGDDYTAGTRATAPAARFTSLLCSALGLTEKNFGLRRTGYSRAVEGSGDYLSRVAAVVAVKPDVVVVSGGRNDVIDDTSVVAANAGALFAQLHAQLPHAALIAIAPLWGDSRPPAILGDIAVGIKAAVTAAGGTYLDISDPLRGHRRWMADDADPNDTGYAAIATAVRTRLAVLVAGARRPAGAGTSATGQ